ncbi:MAG: ABC transporter permease [Bacteroidetes bacterium]|nr:MAG: ABC transporter permease [Bacteroidota bacterium]
MCNFKRIRYNDRKHYFSINADRGVRRLKNIVNRSLKWPAFPSLILLILFFIINVILSPGFAAPNALAGFLAYNVPLVCVAIGVAVVLLTGGIDISLGAQVSLVNVVFVTLIGLKWSFMGALLGAVGSALVFGAINGFIVGFLRVTPLLTTFATSSIIAGLALWIMPTPGGMAPENFITWYSDFIFGIPVPVIFVVISFLLWVIIKYTPLGIWILATGKHDMKAYVSAIPVSWVKFFVYVFASLLSAIGGIALTGSVGSGDPLVGLPIALNAIAACVIGGLSLNGGYGDVWGSIFGGLFLGLVITTVLGANIPSFYQDFVSGIIILFGVLGASMLRKINLPELNSRKPQIETGRKPRGMEVEKIEQR